MNDENMTDEFWEMHKDEIKDIDDAVEKLQNMYIDLRLNYYREIRVQIANTVFFTVDACKEYIRIHRHHFKKPIPYCFTGNNCPEFVTIMAILSRLRL